MNSRKMKIELRMQSRADGEDSQKGVRPVNKDILGSRSVEHKVIWQYLMVSSFLYCNLRQRRGQCLYTDSRAVL